MLTNYEKDLLIIRYLDFFNSAIYMARREEVPMHKAYWLKEAAWYRTQIARLKKR
jgi:hypothetical protein